MKVLKKSPLSIKHCKNHEGIKNLIKPERQQEAVRTTANVVCNEENTAEEQVIHASQNQNTAPDRVVDNTPVQGSEILP